MKTKLKKIWSDKKRYFGMPISFTTYSLSEDRLFVDKGLLKLESEEILLYRIRDLKFTQTLGQRLFKVGSITVQSSDKTAPILVIENVKNAFDVKELLHENVEKMKLSRKMRVGELIDDHYDDRGEFEDE